MHTKSKSLITTKGRPPIREAKPTFKNSSKSTGTAKLLPPIHPGEHLKDLLEERSLSANKAAEMLDVPANRISDIVRGRRGITGDTAIRLEKCFGISAQFWLNLQKRYELQCAQDAASLENVVLWRPTS